MGFRSLLNAYVQMLAFVHSYTAVNFMRRYDPMQVLTLFVTLPARGLHAVPQLYSCQTVQAV